MPEWFLKVVVVDFQNQGTPLIFSLFASILDDFGPERFLPSMTDCFLKSDGLNIALIHRFVTGVVYFRMSRDKIVPLLAFRVRKASFNEVGVVVVSPKSSTTSLKSACRPW